MLLNMFRRAKPQSQTTNRKDIGCHGGSSDEEEESSALIAHSARFEVSETYVVPDIDGHFPTDLSDSDDDFFEKTCPTCQQDLEGERECTKCSTSIKLKMTRSSFENKQIDTETHRHIHQNSDKSDQITRTAKTEEELETAKKLKKISLELQKSNHSKT